MLTDLFVLLVAGRSRQRDSRHSHARQAHSRYVADCKHLIPFPILVASRSPVSFSGQNFVAGLFAGRVKDIRGFELSGSDSASGSGSSGESKDSGAGGSAGGSVTPSSRSGRASVRVEEAVPGVPVEIMGVEGLPGAVSSSVLFRSICSLA